MEDSLVGRRSKRSTAGNRMEAALAEMSVDDLMQDVEEDIDFVSKADEDDVFESDFASTDEEESKDDDEAGERVLQDEEKRVKRAARQKAYTVPNAPARKVKFDSQVPDEETPKQKSKPARRVSLGQVVDAETGEVLEINKRKSNREATRLNTQELQSRLKTAEGRRASLTKRPKETERRKTQAELITAALDMEEDNIKSHRDYLITEEERRKKARVVKASTVGPKLRWRSRVEDVTVTVYDPVLAPHQMQRPTWTSPFATGTNNSTQSQPPTYINPYSVPPGQPPTTVSGTTNTQPPPAPQYPYTYVSASNVRPGTNATASSSKQSPSATTAAAQHYANQYYPYQYYTPPAQGQTQHLPYQQYGQYYAYQPQAVNSRNPLPLHPQAPQPQGLVSRKSTEKQVKNYVEHLMDEERPHEKPSWRESMDALFGKHVDWDNVRVYVGKNRPFARQMQTCPITGLQARYRDPRTGVPYANAGAFRILTRLLEHEYVWSPSGVPGSLGVFVGHEKQRGAAGVPNGWGEAMAGVEDGWKKKRVEGRREEKIKEKVKEKDKEIRVGERRSSRIAAEGGEASEKEPEPMEVDGAQAGVHEGVGPSVNK